MIKAEHLPLIEMALTFVVVIGFCVWQYWSTERSLKRDRVERERLEREQSPADSRHPKR